MSEEQQFQAKQVHLLGMAGLGRNVGFGCNKVFAAALLQSLAVSQPVIGLILGLEGLLGILLNPLTGYISDRTRKTGFRRKVYLLICFPMAAITWLVFCQTHDLVVSLVALCLFYVFQQGSISPYQAWMPGLIPQRFWGLASGYLNLWWQTGNLVAFLVIPLVWGLSHTGAYVFTAVLIATCGMITVIGVPEQVSVAVNEEQHDRPIVRPSYRPLFRGNLILYYIAQTLAWLSFESIASFFTLYIVHSVHGSLMDSALAMSLYTFMGMVAAVFVGKAYRRFAPRHLLVTSFGLFGILALSGLWVHSLLLVFMLVGVEGIFWAATLTVSYALATDLLRETTRDEAQENDLRGGLYGLNNVVQSIGLLVAAPLAGYVIHASGGEYKDMFIVSGVSSLVAIVFVLLIRSKAVPEQMTEDLQA